MSDTIPNVTAGRPPIDNPGLTLASRVRSVDPRFAIALAVPIVLGIAIGAWNLGGKPFWYDETFEGLLVMHPAKQFAYWVATFETTGAFYHSLLWVWKFLGTNEFVLRLPSVIFAVAAIPVTFFVGRRFLSVAWASLACVLLAVSALWLSHAQETRPYALFLLMAGLSTLTLLRATEQPSRTRWILYAIVTVLGVWTHLMMAFVVLAQAMAMVVHPHVRRWWRPAAVAVVLAALAAVPIAYSISHANQARWDWLPLADKQALWEGFRHLTSDPGYLVTDLWMALWAAGILVGVRRFWKDRLCAWPIVLTAVVSVVAVIGPWLGSQIKEMYAPRYVLEALPPMILLATLTMSVLRPRVIGAGLAIVLVGIGLNNIYGWHTNLGWPDFRTAVRVVVDDGGPTDGLAYFYRGAFDPGAQYEYRYYLTQTPGSDDRPTMVLLPQTSEPIEQRVDAAIAAYERLFFIGTPEGVTGSDSTAAITEIERYFSLTRDYDVFGLDVRLYTRSTPSAASIR